MSQYVFDWKIQLSRTTRFSEIAWDTLHKTPDIGWKEPQTQTILGVAHINYPDLHVICNEHAMACAFIASNKKLSQVKDNNDKDFVFYMAKNNNRSHTVSK